MSKNKEVKGKGRYYSSEGYSSGWWLPGWREFVKDLGELIGFSPDVVSDLDAVTTSTSRSIVSGGLACNRLDSRFGERRALIAADKYDKMLRPDVRGERKSRLGEYGKMLSRIADKHGVKIIR